MTTLSFREFQALLIAHGFDMPRFGADGYYGKETAEAIRRWAGSAEALVIGEESDEPEPAPVKMAVIPAGWMPDAKMKRIHTHWTAGSHKASAYAQTRYHILIEGDGKLVRGTYSIKDNEKSGGKYAAHTLGANAGAIGVSMCASAGAIERPYYAGIAPVTKVQWATLVSVVAQLCHRYVIAVGRKTVLSHCEVPKELGIAQNGKWDIAQVPFYDETWTALGDKFRDEVRAVQGKGV